MRPTSDSPSLKFRPRSWGHGAGRRLVGSVADPHGVKSLIKQVSPLPRAIFNEGERDNSCDDVNTIVETKFAPHLKSLALGRTPTKEEWDAVWALTSNFLPRSRK